jgi:dihydrofolate reductase
VLVHGAATAQLALAAGLLDELEIHLIPVLLGQGRRLFDHVDTEHIELERTRIIEGDGVTHLHYVVQRQAARYLAVWDWTGADHLGATTVLTRNGTRPGESRNA